MDILRTYYYDYHCLKISIETNKLQIQCDQQELANAKLLELDCHSLEKKIAARTELMQKQQETLDKMVKVINSIPKQFAGVEYRVFKMRYMEGLTPSEIATKLNYSENYIYKISSKILDSFGKYLKTLNK